MIPLLSTIFVGGSPDLIDFMVFIVLVLLIVFLIRRI